MDSKERELTPGAGCPDPPPYNGPDTADHLRDGARRGIPDPPRRPVPDDPIHPNHVEPFPYPLPAGDWLPTVGMR